MATFSHLDPGTPEQVWREDSRSAHVPELDYEPDELIVVAAHPDDETLGAAGLIRRVHRAAGHVTVIVATDGEGSHPDSPTHAPAQLAARRRREVQRAVEALAEHADLHFLGLPDGALRENRDQLAVALRRVIDARSIAPGGPTRALVVAPWSGDGHRDHRIAAEAVEDVCADAKITQLGYPIWAWHWGTPDDIPWDAARTLRLTPDEVRVKRRAVALHTSQVEPLSPAPGDQAILHPGMRAHFERDVELFICESVTAPARSMTAGWFDDFYRRHEDPWGFETRWYEARKRSVLMAALSTARLGNVLEIGCATGLVTRELVARADHVVALDPVEAALRAARSRLGDDRRVTFVQGRIPDDWPGGRFDTVVLSEVGYYLSAGDLGRTVERIEQCLSDDGCLVACHWRHSVDEYPMTGDDVHAMLRSTAGWEAIVRHEELDFVLEVFCPVPARSVAQREGLV